MFVIMFVVITQCKSRSPQRNADLSNLHSIESLSTHNSFIEGSGLSSKLYFVRFCISNVVHSRGDKKLLSMPKVRSPLFFYSGSGIFGLVLPL